MMDSRHLLSIIQQGENEKAEFKRIWKDEYQKTLCAFANTSGGVLLVGIEDNKEIIGVAKATMLMELQ